MGLEEIVFFALVAVILGIPAVAISARLALRPMVEAIVRLREAFAASGQAPRIVSLEAQVSELRRDSAVAGGGAAARPGRGVSQAAQSACGERLDQERCGRMRNSITYM